MTHLKKATLTSYGKFRNRTLEFDKGLNLVCGPNEAGKTTVMMFLYQMLVGFPARYVAENVRYYPDGGEPEGILILEDEHGDYLLERQGRQTLRGPSMDALLHGVDADLLQDVYSIHLSDIQEFGVLDEDAIRDKVFSAGVVGAGPSLSSVIAELDERAEALGSPTRYKTRIAELVDEMKAVEARLVDAREQMGEYAGLRSEHETAGHRLAALRQTEGVLRRRQEEISLRSDLQPVFNEMRAATLDLGRLHLPKRVPVHAVSRAEELEAEIAGRAAELPELASRAEVKRTSLKGIEFNSDLWEQAEQIESLQLEANGQEVRVERESELHNSVAATRAENERAAQELGELRGTRVEDLSLDAVFYGELDEFSAELGAREDEVRVANRENEIAVQQLEKAREASAGVSAEAVDEGGADLQSAADRLEDLHREFESAQRAREDIRTSVEFASFSKWWLVGMAFAVLSSAVAFWIGQAAAGAVLALLAVGLGAAMAYRAWSEKRARSQADIELARLEKRFSDLEARAESLCAVLGLSWPVTRETLRAVREDVRKWREQAAEARALASRNRELADDLIEARGNAKAAAVRLSIAVEAVKECRGRWENWLKARNLPDATPTVIRRVSDKVKEFQTARGALVSQEELLEKARDAVRHWDEKAGAILKNAGMSVDGDLVAAVGVAASELSRERRRRNQAKELCSEILDVESDHQEAKRALTAAREELSELFGSFEVIDLEELRHRRAATEKADQLESEISSAEREISRRVGSGETADQVRAELGAGRIEHWNLALEQIDEELSGLDVERDDLVAEISELENRMRDLQDSTQVQELELEFESLRTELVETYEQWRQLRVARNMVNEALDKYRNASQPDVLRDASDIFCRVTGGRYDKVMMDDSFEEVVIRRADTGAGTELIRLSAGTAEPLYLAMRMGLVNEFSKKRGAVPVLMDDVLVNLDDERRRSMIGEIARFAEQQQVVFFTCHEHIVREFEDLASPRLLELDESGLLDVA